MDPYEPQYTPNPYGAYFPPAPSAMQYPQPGPSTSSCGDPSFRKSKYQLYPQPPANIPPCETEAMKQYVNVATSAKTFADHLSAERGNQQHTTKTRNFSL